MGVIAPIPTPSRALAPGLADAVADFGHRDLAVGCGAEVPRLGKVTTVLGKALGKRKVGDGRVEHMLPWAHRVWISDLEGYAGEKGTHGVRHETVLRPVAAPDHIAGTCRGDGGRGVVEEEAVSVRACHQLC